MDKRYNQIALLIESLIWLYLVLGLFYADNNIIFFANCVVCIVLTFLTFCAIKIIKNLEYLRFEDYNSIYVIMAVYKLGFALMYFNVYCNYVEINLIPFIVVVFYLVCLISRIRIKQSWQNKKNQKNKR